VPSKARFDAAMSLSLCVRDLSLEQTRCLCARRRPTAQAAADAGISKSTAQR
jgi:hypothetical protein